MIIIEVNSCNSAAKIHIMHRILCLIYLFGVLKLPFRCLKNDFHSSLSRKEVIEDYKIDGNNSH